MARIRERLSSDFRPLCVGAEPDVDALQTFCDRISSAGADSPNLGIVYVRDASELERLIPQYESQERAAGTGPLPVIVVCAKGRLSGGVAWQQSRRHVVLRMPLPLQPLLNTVSDLLG